MSEELEKRQSQLPQVENMIKISKMYGGKVKVGEGFYTTSELEELRGYLKGEITSEISQRVLRLVRF